MSTRRESRERVMQALYAFELGSGDAQHVLETLVYPSLKEDEATMRFAETLFLRSLDMAEDTDAIIGEHTQNWDISRIALVDRLILRLGLCELLTFEDIPPKVSINEAIELAKKYSTGKSGHFVNGILDASLASLTREGRLKKSGRGLVGMTIQGEAEDDSA